MRELSTNSFSKGMMKDLGKSVPQEGSYIEGRNIRIIANEDAEESGIVVNVDGNTFSFELNGIDCADCESIWEACGSVVLEIGATIYPNTIVMFNGDYMYLNPTFSSNGLYVTTAVLAEITTDGTVEKCSRYINTWLAENSFPAGLPLPDCPISIIGYTTIRDHLYLFGSTSTAINPGGVWDFAPGPFSAGYIYKVQFDLISDTPNPELIYYNQSLNFSTAYPIEAIGRFETKDVQRLYWTDNFNPPRTINTASSNILELSPDDLTLNTPILFTKPHIDSVINGGSLPAGMYQYCYRLRMLNGSETRFSPLSGLVHIVQAAEGENYWTYSEDPEEITEYVGTDPGVICPKSVKVFIPNIDIDYDIIEVAAVYRTTPEGITSSYIFSSRRIEDSSMYVTHSSSTEGVNLISLAELTSYTINVQRAKSLASKDNRLFLGNVITPFSEITFNARAYRYRRKDLKFQQCFATETSTYVDKDFDPHADYVKNPELYPEDFEYDLIHNLNAINPVNENLTSVIEESNYYVFQDDGVTLGGEGPNVSYKFIKKELDGDTYVTGQPATSPPFVEVVGSDADCGEGATFLDYKNPKTNAEFKGYQRDETYRFGIVLYDKQGNPGFVEWIGDIRFPRFKDLDCHGDADLYNYTLSQTRGPLNTAHSSGLAFNTGNRAETGSRSGTTVNISATGETQLDGNSSMDMSQPMTHVSQFSDSMGKRNSLVNKHSMYALGIQFTVNIPEEIRSKVSGYSIVRVEREEGDRTVLGVGMGHWLRRYGRRGHVPETYRIAFPASMGSWHYTNTDGNGEQRHNEMSMDSPDFLIPNKYPTAADCDLIEVVGSLNTGASGNSIENDFLGGENSAVTPSNSSDDFYRKFYSHTVLSGYFPGKEVPYGPMDTFFAMDRAAKLPRGGFLDHPNTQYVLQGIMNTAIKMNDSGDDIDSYGTGCDTLYIEFPSYTNPPTNEPWIGLLPAGVTPAFPYYSFWLQGSGNPYAWTPGLDPNQMFFTSNNNPATPQDSSLDGVTSNGWSFFRKQSKPLLAYRRDRPQQYGGSEYADRLANVYIGTNNYVSLLEPSGGGKGIPTPPTDVWGGDTYVHFYDYTKIKRWRGDGAGEFETDIYNNKTIDTMGFYVRYHVSYAFPVETTMNLALRTGHHFANKNNFTGQAEGGQEWDETEYDETYSAENDLQEFYPRSIDFTNPGQYDNRVIYSNEKINGSRKDVWRQFKLDNYRDVDGEYGPINKIVTHADNIYFLQDRGVGMLSINPVATATTDEGALILGTGEVIQDHKYISSKVGCKHQWSVLSTNRGLYWADILTNSIYKLGGQGPEELSRIKGLKSYFEDKFENSFLADTTFDNFSGLPHKWGDNAYYRHGIVSGYDAKNNEVLFSMVLRKPRPMGTRVQWILDAASETIAYSETTGTFTSFYDFCTPLFIDMQDKLLSVNPSGRDNNEVWLHNKGDRGSWYGDIYDTTLEFIINKAPLYTKVFDNLEWYTEGLGLDDTDLPNTTWTLMQCTTD